MEKKVAIIDLGSNSVRMIIFKINKNGSYKMIEQEKEMVRLSEGMGKEMLLKPPAVERTIYTLMLFKKLLDAHNVDKVLTVATAAVRNAKNQKEFLTEVFNKTGLQLTVLSGCQEAYFGYLGVINTLAVNNCLIVDLGGASTELVWVKNRKLEKAISLPFGAVILSELFLEKDTIQKEQLVKLNDFIGNQLQNISWLKNCLGLPIVGLGGTIRSLAKIDKKRTKFPLHILHNYYVEYLDLAEVFNKVINLPLKMRKRIPGLDKHRADIIIGGLAVIKKIMEYLNTSRLTISGNGLREGLFYENCYKDIYLKDKIVSNVLIHSIENILKNYEVNTKHSYHVQKIALSLFDQTSVLHGLGQHERILLSTAALLHDVGIYVDYYNHHKHGFYLTLNSRINGLKIKDLLMCAFIVASHRNTAFKHNIKAYYLLLDKKDLQTIKILSLFLRISENLDRNEYESIENIEIYINKKNVNVKLLTNNTPELEMAAAQKSSKEFLKLFKKNLYFSI